MLARQAQTAVGVLRCPSARIIGRSQVRYASSSSTSSSASTSSAGKYATPAAALTAMIALGAIGYSSQSAGKVEAAKRKSYVERMRLEEKRRAEAESSAGGKEDVASQATSDLEEEVSHQSAFDPETNTINWDCPCLGGMAQGPCGEEFKKAFSCFVFSEQEPKGIECVENFKEMQACFRKYPEHYKDELEDEEESAEGPDVVPNGQNEPSSLVQGEDADEDEGVREWRREMSKE